MTRDLAHVAVLAFNTPLLMHPRKAEVIASVLAKRMSGVAPMLDVAAAKAEAEADRAGRSQMLDRFDGERRGPTVKNAFGETYTQHRYFYRNGLALITVEGTLVNRGAYIGASSGMTSYEGVRAQIASAAADRDVRTILLDLASPGGEATGAFGMADFVRAVAAEKQVVAFVNGMAASAAYAMASGASRIVTTRDGVSGSIGVVLLHLDRSRQLDKMGVVPTLIHAGGHKVDGNPFEPLPDAVRADMQREVDQLYAMFIATVAQGRKGLTEAAIRATEARAFIGADAVAAGLADDIGTIDDFVASFEPRGWASRATTRGATMSQNEGLPAAEAGIAKEAHEAAIAQARADGMKAGAEAERARIGAIVGSEQAKGREALANHLAFKTETGADAALAMLEASPASAAAHPSPFAAALASQRQANLGPGGERIPTAVAPKVIDTASIYARRAAKH